MPSPALPKGWSVEATPGDDGTTTFYVVAGEYANEGDGDVLIEVIHATTTDGHDARSRIAVLIQEFFKQLVEEPVAILTPPTSPAVRAEYTDA